MSFLRTSLVPLLFVAVSLLACEPAAVVETRETQDFARGTRIVKTQLAATYYTARVDTRRCASPMCGGFFISAANQSATQCANGSYADECYVSGLDFTHFDGPTDAQRTVRDAIGLDMETTRVVLLGTIKPRLLGTGMLSVQMAWTALDSLPIVGQFFDTRVNGIVCIVAPCPSYDQELLNRGISSAFHGIDFSAVPPHDTDGSYTVPALNSVYGLIVSGENQIEDDLGPGGSGTILKASQVFIPVGISPQKLTSTPAAPAPRLPASE